MDKLSSMLAVWLEQPWILGATLALLTVIAGYALAFLFGRGLGWLARRTSTELDDKVIALLDRPVFVSVLLYGLSWAAYATPLPERFTGSVLASLKTVAVLVWAGAALRIGHELLEAVSRRAADHSIVQKRTVPVFDMVLKIAVIAGSIYFVFLAWHVDVTAWLASAGIIGIAVGFAAQDSLANLFSGVFIIADAPYKVGDWIVLDGGMRGRVTRIGIRSTRILTRDEVEITIPNAQIGSSKIVNEAGGPAVTHRIGVTVEAAYGSDIELVHRVLLACGRQDFVCSTPAAEVRFRSFGASGLVHQLLVYIDEPAKRGLTEHRLNTAIYKAFADNGIEIPYSKHDVYIKAMPPAETGRRELSSLP